MAQKPRTGKADLNALAARVERLEALIEAADDNSRHHAEHGERLCYCALPPVLERRIAADVSPQRARLIRMIGKKWVNGTTLRYCFYDSGPYAGAEPQKDIVRQGFTVWQSLGIGILFEEVRDISEAEIRIAFLRGDGAWSYVGRDVIDIPGQNEPTMNFGWDLTADPRGVDTPVHEIGHTLGFPHEHQNPFAGIVWNEQAVYNFFSGPPNNWPRERTHYNVLRKLPAGEVSGSEWDPDSIMHYAFPAGLIEQPAQYRDGLIPAGGLSEVDIQEVRRFYPPLDDAAHPELTPFRSEVLALDPGEQKDFVINPTGTRNYTLQTFGEADTVMVLFEDQDGDLKYVAGDDDSGSDRNARIQARLYSGRRYVVRTRLYLNYASAETAVMLW